MKINTKTLRIGNQFIETKTKQVIEVEGLTKDTIYFSGQFEDEWQAIEFPLNNKVLQKMGFEMRVGEINTFFHLEDGCYTYMVSETGKKSTYHIALVDSESGKHLGGIGLVSTVHQLQNKIFPFNNTEIKYAQ